MSQSSDQNDQNCSVHKPATKLRFDSSFIFLSSPLFWGRLNIKQCRGVYYDFTPQKSVVHLYIWLTALHVEAAVCVCVPLLHHRLLSLQMLTYFSAFEVFFEENLPKLFAHFKKNNLTPDIYLIDWWVCLFCFLQSASFLLFRNVVEV